MNGFITAMRTLTIIPVPGREGPSLSAALSWFPAVGLILGLILMAAGYSWLHLVPDHWPAGGALLLVALSVWLTRGLHLDGLADWADSTGGFGRERRLAIMKDVSLGAFGVLALVLVLLAKWVALERILASGSLVVLPLILTVSRTMLVELQLTLPYARPEGGMAKPFTEGASHGHRRRAHGLAMLIGLPLGPFGLALYLSGLLATRLFRTRCQKQFGGITGDLLGTANELTETLLLTLCALPAPHLPWTWLM